MLLGNLSGIPFHYGVQLAKRAELVHIVSLLQSEELIQGGQVVHQQNAFVIKVLLEVLLQLVNALLHYRKLNCWKLVVRLVHLYIL